MKASILYQGPSVLDGAPIVAIMAGHLRPSENGKTGKIPQVYIMRSDVNPVAAIKSGDDVSICGNCPRRGGTCYVQVARAPLSMYRAFERGSYTSLDPSSLRGRFDTVRVGAYGDPAAVPVSVWANLREKSGCRILGYTHQWATHPEVSPFAMASADTAADRVAAKAIGFRTFRVRSNHDPVLPGEMMCPASAEAGSSRTCSTCRACDGSARSAAKVDVVIVQH